MNLTWSVGVPHVEHSSGRGMHFISWIWGKSRQRVRILWNDSSKASRTRISLWMKQFRWPMNDQWIIARVDKRLNCQETWVVLSGTGVDRFVVKTLNWGSGLSFPKSFYMWTMCTRDRCTQIKLLNKPLPLQKDDDHHSLPSSSNQSKSFLPGSSRSIVLPRWRWPIRSYPFNQPYLNQRRLR